MVSAAMAVWPLEMTETQKEFADATSEVFARWMYYP